MGIRAHDTRGVATTWATMAGSAILKQLWMLQPGAGRKPLRSSISRISLQQRVDSVEQCWLRLAQRLENKEQILPQLF